MFGAVLDDNRIIVILVVKLGAKSLFQKFSIHIKKNLLQMLVRNNFLQMLTEKVSMSKYF